jgi:outer membrane receptor protein involved in Fe transport
VLNGSHWLGNDIMISGNAYYRNSNRNTKNGDIWERDMDNGDVYQGVTCVGEADRDGNRSGDCELGGSVMNRTSTKQKNLGFTLQASFNQDLMGKKNQLITGLGFDQSRIGYRQSEQANLSTASDAIADDQITGSTGSAMVFDATRDTVLTGNGALAEFHTTGLKSKQKTMSLFVTDTLSLNDKWHLNAGARYNHTRVNNDDLLRPDPNTNSRSLTADATYARVNPTVGLTFTPSDKISAFGSYSESSRAPTAIELGCSNPANPCLLPSAMADDPPLKQVVARTYDFGLKGSLTDSVKFNASIYQTVNDNDIQFVRSTTLRNGGYFSNVGDTQRRGLDFGLNGQEDKFKWAASYSYIRATFEDDLSLASPANSSAAYGFDNTDRYKINVQKGDFMPSIPKHQLKLRAQYAVTQDWSIGANVIGYTDQYVWGNENNEHNANAAALAATNAEPTGDDSRAACGATGSTSGHRWRGPACGSGKIAGYMVVNLDTQYNIGSGWKAFAKAVNIFDQDYNIAGRLVETNFNSTASYTGDERNVLGLLPGAPRAGWIGVRYEFGGAPEAK